MNTLLTKSSLIAVVLALPISLLACSGETSTKKGVDENIHAKENKEDLANKANKANKADKAKNAEDVTTVAVVEKIENPLDEEAAKKLAEHANEIVKGLAEARKAIASKNQAAAKEALKGAREASDQLLRERPAVDITVDLWAKDKEISASDKLVVDTIPIFASLDRIEERLASPEDVSAREATRKADKGNKLTVGDQHADIDLIDANIVYTEVDMPIASTHVHVVAAQTLVDEGKLEEADEVLARAEAAIEVVQIIDQAPEFKARAAIWDAEAAFAKGDLALAKSLLTAAQTILKTIVSDAAADEDSHKVAQALLDEIAPLKDVLEANNKEQSSALKKLRRGIWSFAQRASARATLLKRRNAQRYALADALLYLERAQSEGLYEGSEDADGALVLVEAMLKSATEKVSPATKPVVEDLLLRTKKLLQLNLAAKRDTVAIKALHQELKFDLRMLMFDLQL